MAIPTHYSLFDHLSFQIQESFIYDDLQTTIRHGVNLRVASVVSAIFTSLSIFVCGAIMAGSFSATYGLSSLLLVPITILAIGLYDTYKVFRCFHNYVWSANKQVADRDQIQEGISNIYDWVKRNKPQWYHEMQWHIDTSIILPLLAYIPLGKMR